MEIYRGTQVDYTPSKPGEQTLAAALNGFPYGNVPFFAVKGTYVWAISEHLETAYVIEHPQGHPKSYFLAGEGFPDGFESIPSKYLDDRKHYIYADINELKIV